MPSNQRSPFEELTLRGRVRRMRKLALNALQQYELDIAAIHFMGWYTNLLFRLHSTNGPDYVLRICAPGWRTDTDLRSEAIWLQALACSEAGTDIGAPIPVPARNGAFVVEARADGVPAPRRCTIMSWIPGTPLEKRLTRENLYKMGVLFARLHVHGANFSPPEGFTQRKMDRVLARDEADVLFLDACREAFNLQTRAVFERTRHRVDEAYAQLYADPTDLRVIHHDLWHGNIKIHRGRLRPLDFEDTVWGYPVQDIAMALQDLMTDVAPEEFEPLQAAFRQGYESLAQWPELYAGQIDTFRAGRMLWVANYVARFERQHLAGHIQRVAPLLERFLETGKLRKTG